MPERAVTGRPFRPPAESRPAASTPEGVLTPCAPAASEPDSPRVTFMPCRWQRALATVQAARQGGHTLAITGSAGSVREAAFQHIGMQGKVLVLDQVVEAPELTLRLSEIETGVYALVAIAPFYLWHPRAAAALNAWGPRRVLIDAAALEAGAQESLSSGLAALLHARDLFPGADFHMLASPVTVQSVAASALARDGVPSFSGPLLPPTVALAGSQLRAEHDLLDVLRAAIAGQGSTAIVLAPSRGRAAALARRLGSLAIAYHGGLSASEQLAALEAFRAGRAHALVATEAVTTIDLLPAPSVIVFAHPPRTLDTLFRACSWVERSPTEVPLVTLYGAADLAALRGVALSGFPTLADLRCVYRALRAAAEGPYVRADPVSLGTRLGEPWRDRPQLVSLCLELLERAGYLSRGDDIVRVATVTAMTGEQAVLGSLFGTAVQPERATWAVDPLQLALATGRAPSDVQRSLLSAEQAGLVQYRSAGRERVYEFREPPKDGAATLSRSIQSLCAAALAEAYAVRRFLEAPGCRAQALAAALGLPPELPCGRCDRCKPRPTASTVRPKEDWLLALRALASVPLAVPVGTAYRIVQQALRQQGRLADRQTACALVQGLAARNLLESQKGALGELLAVSTHGQAILGSLYQDSDQAKEPD